MTPPPSLRFEDLSPVLREFLARQEIASGKVSLAGYAGSRRAYYRLEPGGGPPSPSPSYIVMVAPEDDADFGRFLRITQFYRMLGVPVPRVYCIDDPERQVLLEDLGDRRLYDLLRKDRSAGLAGYRRALDLLADLQTRCQAYRSECPDICSRVFSREHLLWETSYYRDNYLEAHRGLRSAPRLQEIFADLATRVDGHTKAILHRDFQSQNLMVEPTGAVRVIDYQGSRLGSVHYDLASLLLDPYVLLSDGEIEDLLEYFHRRTRGAPPHASFRAAFLEAGMQRIMQALGAYCYLSRVKGLASFEEHIPAGERRLRWVIRQSGNREWEAVLPD